MMTEQLEWSSIEITEYSSKDRTLRNTIGKRKGEGETAVYVDRERAIRKI